MDQRAATVRLKRDAPRVRVVHSNRAMMRGTMKIADEEHARLLKLLRTALDDAAKLDIEEISRRDLPEFLPLDAALHRLRGCLELVHVIERSPLTAFEMMPRE